MMTDQISRRKFVWLCLGATGAACTVLVGCSNEVAAEQASDSPVLEQNRAQNDQTSDTDVAPEPTAVYVSQCPKGLLNDPYPGRCKRYIDTNGDGICDLSQPL